MNNYAQHSEDAKVST